MMRRRRIVAMALVLGLALPAGVARADGESPDAAKALAMLKRVVVAVKQDETAALLSFTKGTNGFAEGDLYPYCARARSGWVVAHPSQLGTNLADQSDVNGKLFGKEILNSAVAGEIKEIHYMWPKPGQKTPAKKDTYYTKVDKLVCAVGYYP